MHWAATGMLPDTRSRRVGDDAIIKDMPVVAAPARDTPVVVVPPRDTPVVVAPVRDTPLVVAPARDSPVVDVRAEATSRHLTESDFMYETDEFA
jgi:hypothetical protein